MIFLDTSGIYALADIDDENHGEAVRVFNFALQSGELIVTHNYVLVESAALLQRRLGLKTALAFLDEARSFRRVWVDEELHEQAAEQMSEKSLSRLSLVDVVSFLVMRKENISSVLGFDGHFEDAGFQRYRG
jgi:uncharacterized protein